MELDATEPDAMHRTESRPRPPEAPASTRIVRGELFDEVVQRVRQMILEGELPAGTRVPERLLCEQLGISRTPLREAMRALAAEGLVDLAPRRGATVSRMSVADVNDMFEVMEALEALAGELACNKITDAGIAEVRRLHEQMVACYERRDRPTYFQFNQRIHEALVRIADNSILSGVYATLSARIRRARYMANHSEERWHEAVAEHELILEALSRRDAKRLSALLKDHLRHKRKSLDGTLSEP